MLVPQGTAVVGFPESSCLIGSRRCLSDIPSHAACIPVIVFALLALLCASTDAAGLAVDVNSTGSVPTINNLAGTSVSSLLQTSPPLPPSLRQSFPLISLISHIE